MAFAAGRLNLASGCRAEGMGVQMRTLKAEEGKGSM